MSVISSWEINDTIHFNISTNGIISNITKLEVGIYYLEARAYDPSNHNCSAIFRVIVQEPDPTPTLPPDLIPSFIPIILIGILGCLSSIFAIKIKKRIL